MLPLTSSSSHTYTTMPLCVHRMCPADITEASSTSMYAKPECMVWCCQFIDVLYPDQCVYLINHNFSTVRSSHVLNKYDLGRCWEGAVPMSSKNMSQKRYKDKCPRQASVGLQYIWGYFLLGSQCQLSWGNLPVGWVPNEVSILLYPRVI